MGSRGPMPTPTAVLEARGSKRAKRPSEPDIKPMDNIPTPPRGLKAAGLHQWNTYLPQLIGAGILTAVDMPAFEDYCWTYQEWADLQKVLDKDGIQKGEGINPLYYIVRDLKKDVKEYWKCFGMTPSSRPNIKATGNIKSADETEEDFT